MSHTWCASGNSPYRRTRTCLIRLRVLPRRWIGIFLALFSVAALVLPAAWSGAQDPSGGAGAASGEVTLPEALGEARSVRVAPATGAVSDSISIDVPPGRRNVEPHLALAYSSTAAWGDVGVGWQVDTGRIERWRGDGTPGVGDPWCSTSSV